MNWTEEAYAEHMTKLKQPIEPQPVKVGPLESLIEAECTRILEEDGWRALRTDPVSDRSRGKGFGELGMADHLYIRYTPFWRQSPDCHYLSASHTLWIEFKRPGEKAQKHQAAWHIRERARGALTLIAGEDFEPTVDGFRKWYAASGLRRQHAAR